MPIPLASPAARPAASSAGASPIRVFVVDDSNVVRAFLTKLLNAATDVELVGVASDGSDAIKRLQGQTVDVVVLDIEMPVLDGLSALPQILKATKQPPKVVMASTLTTRGASISIQALVKGAADYVPKPTSVGGAGAEEFGRALLDRVRVWGAAALKERGAGARPAFRAAKPAAPIRPAPPSRARASDASFRPAALAIGCSTGGPQALLKIMPALKGKRLGPIFVTQHMPPTFTKLFADQLARASGRTCHEGEDGETVRDDVVYLAPGDFHMVVEKKGPGMCIRRLKTPQENYCRPAVDPMFRSLADAYRDRLLAVVLTGMGQDGREGARVVVDRGGMVLAQDEATSVVWGMPGAVAEASLAREILPLDAFPDRVAQLFRSVA